MTKEVFSIMSYLPRIDQLPSNIMLAVAVVAGFIVLMFLWFFISDFFKHEKKEHKAPETHEVLQDLKQALVKEMKGTSNQNWIMIILTVVFIAVSVLGTEGTVKIAKKAWKTATKYVVIIAEKVKGPSEK